MRAERSTHVHINSALLVSMIGQRSQINVHFVKEDSILLKSFQVMALFLTQSLSFLNNKFMKMKMFLTVKYCKNRIDIHTS